MKIKPEKQISTAIVIFTASMLAFSGCTAKTGYDKNTEKPECDQTADRYIMSGDLETGIRLHEEFIKKNPDNAVAHYHLGYALGQKGAREAEIFHYEKAAALGYKGSSDLFFNLGMAYAESYKYEKAEKAFLKSLEIYPGKFETRLLLARLYLTELEKPEKAREHLLIILRLDPENEEALELYRHLLNQ